ncbi:MAG: enoyl-CoA hydratase/isomerase family protein [Sphingomonadaceae bacterium]|nr:enoyl-CoA hydratase/isomerase family protein [Sphingomonadaceae bacterium]
MDDSGNGALVLREDSDGICTLTLNRPEKKNAIDRALFKEFRRHIAAIESGGDDIGCVVIRGAGDGFCAGHDLKETPHSDRVGWIRHELLTLEKLTRLRQPVIAQVHGWCMTAGLELALSCDFIIAGESAQFADTHAKWGMVPGWGMSQRLPRRVGQAKALEMMLTCRRYSGRQAEAMGLANECVSDVELTARAREIAQEIMANSWHANGANKKLIYETDGLPLMQGLTHELMRNEGLDKDAAERRGAFQRKG